MSDPRLLKSNGRVAHVDLQGQIEADRFVAPRAMQVQIAKTPIWRTPDGPMDRELLCGDVFHVLEWREDDPNAKAFGYAEKDGYCGYVHGSFLHDEAAVTHIVAVRETYRQESADLKASVRKHPLYFGSRLTVIGTEGNWSKIALRLGGPGSDRDFHYFVPSQHVVPVDHVWTDPVAVARLFLGAPYVWGGNAGNGLDCSGLVQAALLAAGIDCPGDSDQQAAMPWLEAETVEAGDLLFWEGHVAMATGPDTMIHANAHHMSVVEETIDEAVARILAKENSPVTKRLRPKQNS